MATYGAIKRLVRDEAFGFVAAADETEYVFYWSLCTAAPFDSPHGGDAVTFDKGP